MRRVFKDARLQEKFDREGFLVLPSFLDEDGINHLQNVFSKSDTGKADGFHVTNWSPDTEYRAAADLEIRKVLTAKARIFLDDYKPVLGVFAAKMTGQGSEMGLHQDWSIVDESLFTSVSFWVPLIDVDETNGALQVFPGSHHIFQNLRGQNIRFPFHDNPVQDLIKEKYLKNISLQAGDAFVLHHRIVHKSMPNLSGSARVAAMLAMAPSESKIYHYYKSTPFDQPGNVEVFECADDFYTHFNIQKRPTVQRPEKTFPFDEKLFSKEELVKAASQNLMSRNTI